MSTLHFIPERAGSSTLYHAGVQEAHDPALSLATPVLFASNALFAALQWPAFRTARVDLHDTGLVAAPAGRARIFYTWHRLSWVSHLALRALPREQRPVSVAHDGWASRLNQRGGAWFGFDMLVFARHCAISPREQIAGFLREQHRDLMIFPDSGGPYGELKPGVLEIARASDALLVPYTIRATGTLTFGRTLRHVVPLPFCRIAPHFGTAIEATTASLDQLSSALMALES